MKTCNKCNIEKDLSCFSKHNQMKSGYRNDCKTCVYQRTKKWVLSNKEKSIIAKKKHYKYNCEKIKKRSKKYRIENNEKLKDYYKKYNLDNSEKRQAYGKKWREKNKKHIREQQTKRRENDPLFKLTTNLRSRTYEAFKKSKSWFKNGGTVKMLGCSFETAHKHIERQFEKGMTWDNHGEWHIDHIIPLSSANTEEELIKLCHYRNLQPLWAKDNLEKSNKIPKVQIQFKI